MDTQSHLRRDDLVRRGMRFSQLRLVVALAETGQVSSAAAQVGMTQPSASRLLSELEQATGAKLYERHPRGVTLTDAGVLFVQNARAVLHQLDKVQSELQQLTLGARGLVRIGTVTGPGLELVLPLIRELRVTRPEIELMVQVDTSDKLAEQLLSHELDFYIGRAGPGIDPRALELELLSPEPMELIARPGHPLFTLAAPTLSDCLIYDWVMQPPGGLLRTTVESYLLHNRLRPPARVLSTSSLLLTLAVIGDTNAIAPVSKPVADFYSTSSGLDGNIRILRVPHRIEVVAYSIVTRRDEPRSPVVAHVLEAIRAKAAQATAAA